MSLIIPKEYKNLLDTAENTERAIKKVKDTFQITFSSHLDLLRVTAPMVVVSGTGFNDDLNGVEKAVSFPIKDMPDTTAEVVHSLAKWKRWKLSEMNIPAGKGLYTDMNALRPQEELDNIHSLYVDQWDWEKVITKQQRNIHFLKNTVTSIYKSLKATEEILFVEFPELNPCLPDDIFFIHSQELLDMYPNLSPKERENEITRQHKAVFVIGIGGNLSDGKPHDLRAADYDDWSTQNEDGYYGLNGDILLWNPILESAFEISSMGIRVDEEALARQLALHHEEHKAKLSFHKMLLNGELPYTIGGGIGQSRLCMFLLRKAHIGEVQSSIWPEEMKKECRKNGIFLA